MAAGVHVRQLSPTKVHAHAGSVGRRAKTDACDAAMIAAYMAANPQSGRRILEANVTQIRALTAKRRQLVDLRKALSCQTQQGRHGVVAGLDTAMMALSEEQIATVEATIEAVIRAEDGLAAKRRLLRSIPGIGEVLAVTLLGEMPELGQMTAGAAASLAGLALFVCDNGTLSGTCFIPEGRSTVRDVLCMAAVSASCHAPDLKRFA